MITLTHIHLEKRTSSLSSSQGAQPQHRGHRSQQVSAPPSAPPRRDGAGTLWLWRGREPDCIHEERGGAWEGVAVWWPRYEVQCH